MVKGKSSDDNRYDPRVGGGRVADKEKNTVYSPSQIDKMKEKSDERRDEKKR